MRLDAVNEAAAAADAAPDTAPDAANGFGDSGGSKQAAATGAGAGHGPAAPDLEEAMRVRRAQEALELSARSAPRLSVFFGLLNKRRIQAQVRGRDVT
jgi:hypothetical protein